MLSLNAAAAAAAVQALLALASKPQGMDALLHSPPTLKRLVATLQMAHIDTSLPKLALQVGKCPPKESATTLVVHAWTRSTWCS
eukprot:1150998-Pelagomonas_calceolata.AAC.4